MRARTAIMAAALTALVLGCEGTAWSQCAMCRAALENMVEGEALVSGFRSGILLLLAAPYAILGSIAFGLIRAYRKRAR